MIFIPLDSFLQPWDTELIPGLEKMHTQFRLMSLKPAVCLFMNQINKMFTHQQQKERVLSLLTILWNLLQYPTGLDQSRPADRGQMAVLLINDQS